MIKKVVDYFFKKDREELFNSHLNNIKNLFEEVCNIPKKKNELEYIISKIQELVTCKCESRVSEDCEEESSIFSYIEETYTCKKCQEEKDSNNKQENPDIKGLENTLPLHIEKNDKLKEKELNQDNKENNNDKLNEEVNNKDLKKDKIVLSLDSVKPENLPIQKLFSANSEVMSLEYICSNWLVSGHADGEILVWDMTRVNGKVFSIKKHKKCVYSLKAIPELNLLISGETSNLGLGLVWKLSAENDEENINDNLNSKNIKDNKTSILNNNEDTFILKLKLTKSLQFENKGIVSLAYLNKLIINSTNNSNLEIKDTKNIQSSKNNSNSTCVIIACGMKNGAIFIWNVTSNQALFKFQSHTGPILTLYYSNDLLFSGGDDNYIFRYSFNPYQICTKQFFKEHKDYVLSISGFKKSKEIILIKQLEDKKLNKPQIEEKVTKEYEFILSSSNDKTIKVWVLFTDYRSSLLTVNVHSDFVYHVYYNEIDDVVVSVSADKTIKFTKLTLVNNKNKVMEESIKRVIPIYLDYKEQKCVKLDSEYTKLVKMKRVSEEYFSVAVSKVGKELVSGFYNTNYNSIAFCDGNSNNITTLLLE
jgi:WD40 repeat protein